MQNKQPWKNVLIEKEQQMTETLRTESPETIRPARVLLILIAIIGLFSFQQFASQVGSVVANLFDYNPLDPNNAFLRVSIHHVIQALIALVPILFFAMFLRIDFGFKPGNVRLGFKLIGIMTAAIIVYMVVSYVVGYSFDLVKPYPYPLNARNITGTLGFQLFLSGPSEEILFRALPIALLSFLIRSESKSAALFSSIMAGLLFSIAHIRWSITPNGLVLNYDIFQLMYAFVLGTAQGIIFLKTKSVYYSMAVHSISNIIATGFGYLIVLYIL